MIYLTFVFRFHKGRCYDNQFWTRIGETCQFPHRYCTSFTALSQLHSTNGAILLSIELATFLEEEEQQQLAYTSHLFTAAGIPKRTGRSQRLHEKIK